MNVKKSVLGKYVLNGVFLIALFLLTIYVIFKDQEIDDILKYMKLADNRYLFAGVVMTLIYICSESVIIHYIMNSLSYSVKMLSCIKYSFVGFFVSAITPSASGGQPAQMYVMSNDGIKVSASSLVLMIVTIAYKAVLIIMGAFMLLTEPGFVIKYVFDIKIVLIFGILVNIVIVSFLLFVIFKQSFAEMAIVAPIIFLGKKRIIKNYTSLANKVLQGVRKYEVGADYLRTHKHVFINTFVLTIFQRACLFYVTYLIYRSFGLNGVSAYQIVTLQTMVALSVDILPLPGGMGASESIFIILFGSIFGDKFILPSMILNRGITYYAIIVVGGLVTAYALIQGKRQQKNTLMTGEIGS